MTGDQLAHIVTEVRRLRRRFADTTPKAWHAMTACAELTVQLGHLAHCLLNNAGDALYDLDDPDRPIDNPGDELADVVVAAVSVAILSGTPPRHPPSGGYNGAEERLYLRLVAAAGVLSEAAMVAGGYRHRPTGQLIEIDEACAVVLTLCDRLAAQLGLDLPAEFDAMTADADTFLDRRPESR